MKLFEELRDLSNRNWKLPDNGVRIFYDGSIRTLTITGSGRQGWYIVATGIPGAAQIIGRYFPGKLSEERFLNMPDLRRAVKLRDKILVQVTESKARRMAETDLRNADESGSFP